ncbi:MAG: energy-coupled thiamine transporter ThiT, partial [Lachnospiraceae bacterium]|nr:energy-coupled thiamine transporter ThiT [Lachnospiraceae bacterium]
MKNNVKNLSVCAMLIALSLVCSKIKIFSLPLGGSITLFSMLIISIPGYLYGVKYGFVSSFIYSLFK